jgi:hypothetical protein
MKKKIIFISTLVLFLSIILGTIAIYYGCRDYRRLESAGSLKQIAIRATDILNEPANNQSLTIYQIYTKTKDIFSYISPYSTMNNRNELRALGEKSLVSENKFNKLCAYKLYHLKNGNYIIYDKNIRDLFYIIKKNASPPSRYFFKRINDKYFWAVKL